MSCFPGLEQSAGCPLCHGVKHKLVSSRGEQSLKKCLGCGVHFIFPQPTPASLVEHFRGETYTTTFDGEINREKVLHQVARHVQDRKPGGTILDVGCATGVFLSSFFPEAKWNRVGVELTPSSANQAQKK